MRSILRLPTPGRKGAPTEFEAGSRGDDSVRGDSEVLRFDSVTRRYGDVVAVDSATFSVEAGSFVALLGPSGCGKTTTLRLVAGFEQPDSGAIYIDGQPVAEVPAHRRPVNTVFQDFSLFPHMTVFDNVAFGPKLRKLPKREIEQQAQEMLELVRLGGVQQRRPHQLSGGQQQRIALARALVNRPAILLLDEPLSNLDYRLRKDMRVELKRIQREVHTTFILVTHDQEEALTMADHIIVMDSGKIQQIGPPADLYHAPVNTFVANFMGVANFLEGAIVSRCDSRIGVRVDGLPEAMTCPDIGSPVGARVVLCVRAENIELSRADAGRDANAVQGTVEESLYLGDRSELVIRLANDTTIQAQQLHSSDEARFGVGEQLHLTWDHDDTFVLQAE